MGSGPTEARRQSVKLEASLTARAVGNRLSGSPAYLSLAGGSLGDAERLPKGMARWT
jgi:hypothetical protein